MQSVSKHMGSSDIKGWLLRAAIVIAAIAARYNGSL